MHEYKSQKDFIKTIIINKVLIITIRLLLFISILVIWEILSKRKIINPFIYSSPTRIIKTINNLIIKHNLYIHILTTLKETLIAFFLGIIISYIIAIIFYYFKIIAKIFDPLLTVINSLPKVALGPIIIIITGANTKSVILMALLINLIVNITTIYNGFINIDPIRIKLFNSFKANKLKTLINLVIPSTYNTLISSLKLNIAFSLIGVITGEFLVSKSGLGYLIIYGTQIFDLDLVLSSITVLIVLSYILYKIVIILEHKLIKE